MKTSFCMKLICVASVVGLVSTFPMHPSSAQNLGDVVRGLNSVINPGDAQRYEDQARRDHRPDEERYWRDYRRGLDAPDHRDSGDRRGAYRFDPSDPRTFRSDAAISLEVGRLSRDEQRRYRDMSPTERRRYDDRLADDARSRYERMTDPERQRYVDDLDREQRRLDSARRR
jgi:hypothetical protein